MRFFLLIFLVVIPAIGSECSRRLEHEFEYLRQIKMYEDLRAHAERIEHEEGWLAAKEFTEDIDRRIAAIRESMGAIRE